MTTRHPFLNSAAGGALGLTVGVLAGMAVSPVIGALLGTVATGGMAFLTFRREDSSPEILLRVIAFGLASLMGVFGGVYLRANNILGLTPKRFVQQLEDIGVKHDDAVARYFLRAATEPVLASEGKTVVDPGLGGLFSGAPGAQNDALRDTLRRSSDWTQISNNVRLAFPQWLNTVQAIDQMNLAAQDKRRLLLALANQPKE